MKTLNNHHTCYPYLTSAEGGGDECTHSGQWLHVCGTVCQEAEQALLGTKELR